jgi:hypothetical protein
MRLNTTLLFQPCRADTACRDLRLDVITDSLLYRGGVESLGRRFRRCHKCSVWTVPRNATINESHESRLPLQWWRHARSGEQGVPDISWIEATLKVTEAVCCTGCRHCHLLEAGTRRHNLSATEEED